MSYVKALLDLDNFANRLVKTQEPVTKTEGSTGLIQKPFELDIPEVETSKTPFSYEYLNLKALEERIQNAKDTDFADEGTGPSTVESGDEGATVSRPVRNPKYSARQGYPVEQAKIEAIIAEEAELRGIDPNVAIRLAQHEGMSSYQSQVPRTGKGSLNGLEASFGPFQLFVGGGLGNQYEKETGRNLETDNTEEGIRQQTRFALDQAAKSGWGAWYGRKPAGIGVRDGLQNAKPIGNWKNND